MTERANARPAPAVEASDLVGLVRSPGPFLTVELVTSSRAQNAQQVSERRWRNERRGLADRGVPERVLAAVDAAVPRAHLEGDRLVVVATDAGQQLVAHGDVTNDGDRSWWEPTPHLITVLRWRQAELPHVVVVADRTGAEIVGVAPGLAEIERGVDGEHDVIHKVAAGGWSQRRYQQRAEDSWERNAESVADVVRRMAEHVQARLVVVYGDVRAIHLVRDALPDLEDRIQLVEHQPTRDDGIEEVAERTQGFVAAAIEAETERLMAVFREEVGQGDRATEGLTATVDALSRAQVDVLLLSDGADDDDRRLWCGPDPAMIATEEAELHALGVEEPQPAPASDVLVRATIGTSAAIRLLPVGVDRPRDGVGALLRWS